MKVHAAAMAKMEMANISQPDIRMITFGSMWDTLFSGDILLASTRNVSKDGSSSSFSRRQILAAATALAAVDAMGGFTRTAITAPRPQVENAPGNAAAYRWNNVAIHGGGFVVGIIAHPTERGLIYARTDVGGAYRLDSGTNRWTPITDWVGGPDWYLSGIESLAVDPTDVRRVYIAAGMYSQAWAENGAILRSVDQGRTWDRINLPIKLGGNEAGRFNGERLAVDPNAPGTLFFGSRHNGLWKSDNHADSWHEVKSFPKPENTGGVGVVFVIYDTHSSTPGHATRMIYAGVSTPDGGMFRSTDAGATWLPLPHQPHGLRPNHAALAADGTLYISYGKQPGPNSMTDGAVWKFNTRDDSWTDITPLSPARDRRSFGYGTVAIDVNHPGTVMAGTFCRWNGGDIIFRSTDAGKTWKPISPQHGGSWSVESAPWLNFHSPHPMVMNWIGSLQIDPHNSNRVLYTTGWGIFESTDVMAADSGSQTHWRFFCDGFEETVVLDLISPPAGAHLLSSMGDIGGFKHDNLRVSPPSGMLNPNFGSNTSIDFAEHKPAFMVRVYGGQRVNASYSMDGGTSWTALKHNPQGGRFGVVAVSSDARAIVWTAASSTWGQPNHTAQVTYDRGESWRVCRGLRPGWQVISDRVDPHQFYAFSPQQGRIYRSVDAGVTFHPLPRKFPKGTGRLCAAPGQAGDLWLASQHGLFYCGAFGAAASKIANIDSADQVGFGRAAPALSYPAIFLVGRLDGVYGIYRSDDAGANWVRINDFQHQFFTINTITGDPRIYGRVYLGTSGRGIIYGDPT
jgi:photosystem II stability/assembly factor-like uncharacterized protein